MQYIIGKSVSVHRGNVKDEKSNQNQIVFTLFRLNWTYTVYDFVDDFEMNKNDDREMRGQDSKFERVGMDLKS